MAQNSQLFPSAPGIVSRRRVFSFRRVRRQIRSIPVYLVFVIWAVAVVFPLVWMFYTSLKTNRELYASVWCLPALPQIGN